MFCQIIFVIILSPSGLAFLIVPLYNTSYLNSCQIFLLIFCFFLTLSNFLLYICNIITSLFLISFSFLDLLLLILDIGYWLEWYQLGDIASFCFLLNFLLSSSLFSNYKVFYIGNWVIMNRKQIKYFFTALTYLK